MPKGVSEDSVKAEVEVEDGVAGSEEAVLIPPAECCFSLDKSAAAVYYLAACDR
jgi:hypothetical protein